jgi:hypothetical protein
LPLVVVLIEEVRLKNYFNRMNYFFAEWFSSSDFDEKSCWPGKENIAVGLTRVSSLMELKIPSVSRSAYYYEVRCAQHQCYHKSRIHSEKLACERVAPITLILFKTQFGEFLSRKVQHGNHSPLLFTRIKKIKETVAVMHNKSGRRASGRSEL